MYFDYNSDGKYVQKTGIGLYSWISAKSAPDIITKKH